MGHYFGQGHISKLFAGRDSSAGIQPLSSSPRAPPSLTSLTSVASACKIYESQNVKPKIRRVGMADGHGWKFGFKFNNVSNRALYSRY